RRGGGGGGGGVWKKANPAVPVEHRRIRAVFLQILAVRDEKRHARAVFRRREDAFGRVERWIERQLRRLERRARPGRRIELKHRDRIQRRREGVEDLRSVVAAGRAADRADARRLELSCPRARGKSERT